jgi:hypothetical protein
LIKKHKNDPGKGTVGLFDSTTYTGEYEETTS